jgi:hypothetical protein
MKTVSNFLFICIFIPLNLFADTSDFLNLCKTHFKDDSARIDTCERVNKVLFSGVTSKEASTLTTPEKIGATAMPVDKKVLFMALNDPNYMPALVYCYSVYHHWINPTQISPDALGMLSSGVSILNEQLSKYQTWLNTSSEGKSCRTLVEKESGLPVSNLEDSLKGYAAMIVLNPYAVIRNHGNDYNLAMDELRLTMNHERIHAYHVLCPQFEKSELAKWVKLSQPEKNKFIEKFPNYNWNDLKTAGREYSAFTLETSPDAISGLVKTCKIK